MWLTIIRGVAGIVAEGLQKDIEEAQSTKLRSEAQLDDVKEKMADAEGYHQREIKKAEEAMNNARKRAQQATKEASKFQQQVNEIRLDIDELNRAIETQQEEITTCEQSCVKLSSEVEQHVTQEKTAKVYGVVMMCKVMSDLIGQAKRRTS